MNYKEELKNIPTENLRNKFLKKINAVDNSETERQKLHKRYQNEFEKIDTDKIFKFIEEQKILYRQIIDKLQNITTFQDFKTKFFNECVKQQKIIPNITKNTFLDSFLKNEFEEIKKTKNAVDNSLKEKGIFNSEKDGRCLRKYLCSWR